MKVKSKLALILAGSSLLLTACGNGNDSSQKNQSQKTSSESSSEKVAVNIPSGKSNFFVYVGNKVTKIHLKDEDNEIKVPTRDENKVTVKGELPLVGQVKWDQSGNEVSHKGMYDQDNYDSYVLNRKNIKEKLNPYYVDNVKNYFKAGQEKNVDILENATLKLKSNYQSQLNIKNADEDPDKRMLEEVYFNPGKYTDYISYDADKGVYYLYLEGMVKYKYDDGLMDPEIEYSTMDLTFVLKGNTWKLDNVDLGEGQSEIDDQDTSSYITTKVN